MIQQPFHFVVSIARRDGDSHTHSDESLLAATNDRFTGDGFAQFVGAQQSVGQIAVGENQKKFLSAVSADTVVDSELFAQPPRDFPERLIAKKMAEGVVHALEMVDVTKDHSHGLVLPACSLQFPQEHGENLSAIHQSSEAIVGGGAAHGLARGN